MGHKNTGYESGGPQGGPRWARSSGTAQKSCCHRRDTCALQRVGEGSIQAPLIPYPATNPARGILPTTLPLPSTPIPLLGHQNTPRFCRNSDLTPICSSWFSNKTPLFLHTNLGRVVGVRMGDCVPHLSCSPAHLSQNSLIQQFVCFWNGRAYVLRTWAGGEREV